MSSFRYLAIAAALALFVFLAVDPWDLYQSKQPSTTQAVSSQQQQQDYASVAEKWDWSALATEKESDASDPATLDNPYPFSPEAVYNALQAVKLDSDGNVVLDHDAKLSLDEALERIYSIMDTQSTAALKQLIESALAGFTGEQVAQLVEDYLNYLVAKDEFSELYESASPPQEDVTLDSVNKDQTLYSELQSLRNLHLGADTAESLFRVEDASAKMMFDSMKLAQNTALSAQERALAQEQIQARLIEESLNIDSWDARYNAYLDAREVIESASLSSDEIDQQITQLTSQHFTSEERQKMAFFGLGQL